MDAMFVLLVLVVGPVLFFLLTWVVATVYRLYFPEQPLPLESNPVVVRQRAAANGKSVSVGVREIRADQRWAQRNKVAQSGYHYAWGGSDGFPEIWYEDLWQRRN